MNDEMKRCKFCGEEILQVAGEILGIFLLIVPFITTLLIWFWIGNMTILESPGSKLNFIAIGTIILTGIIAAIEANQLGFGQNKSKSGKMSETGPAGYFFGFALLWIIIYPLYLYKRSTKGKRNLLIGGILVALIFTGSYIYFQNIINERISQISKGFSLNKSQIIENETGNKLSDEIKFTRTLKDMKSIGIGIEMYRTQVGFLPNANGTAETVFASVSALAIITGSQRAIKDGWGNDFIIISNADADSYVIGSCGKDGIFKGWAQTGPLLSESDYNQDIIYADGTYVTNPQKQVNKDLYTRKEIDKNLMTIRGTLYFSGESCFLSNSKGESLYIRNTVKIMDIINDNNMSAKPVVINGVNKKEDENGLIYYDASSPQVEILLEKPIKSYEDMLEGRFEAEDSMYFITKNGSYLINIIGNSDKKSTWERLYKLVDSQDIVKFKGLIEEYSNGNKFININTL